MPDAVAPGAPAGPSSSLRSNRDFLRLWAGQAVSLTGSFAGQLVFPLVAVLTLQASPFELGLISASQYLPVLFMTVIAGYWLDRIRRRPVLVWANITRAALLGGAAVLVATGALSVWSWCLVAFLLGSITAVFDVAWHSYMPTVVRRDQLVDANARLQATYSSTQVLGTASGGVLLNALTPVAAFGWNMAAYLVAAFLFASIRGHEPPLERPVAGEGFLVQLTRGFRFVWADLPIRAMMLSGAWFNFCEQALLTLFLIYGAKDLGLDPALLGLSIGLGSVGATLGAVVARRLGDRFGTRATFVATMGLTAISPLLIPLNGSGGIVAVVSIIVAFNGYGLGQTVFNVFSVALRQERTPTALLGRVSAAFRTVAFGMLPVGALVGGALGQTIGVRMAIFVVVGLFVAGWVVFALTAAKAIPGRANAGTGAEAEAEAETSDRGRTDR
jgi:MFS family permease